MKLIYCNEIVFNFDCSHIYTLFYHLYFRLYKKATGHKKKEVTYVVAKKFNTGKRMKRPAGVKGPIRVVDGRMKKDLRKMKSMSKGKGKKGKSSGTGKGKPKGRGGKR